MLLEVKDHLRFSSSARLAVPEPPTHTPTLRLQTVVSLEVVQKLFPAIPPFVSPLSGLSSGFFSLQLLTLLEMLFNLSPSFL